MQKGHTLQLNCISCTQPVSLSIFELEKKDSKIICQNCGKQYAFDDENLLRQLKQFEALCRQIHASKEILGDCAVGIDVGDNQVKVPFKILLTRFNSTLDLNIGDQKISICFRLEPIDEMD